jgi:hypothetical protein
MPEFNKKVNEVKIFIELIKKNSEEILNLKEEHIIHIAGN